MVRISCLLSLDSAVSVLVCYWYFALQLTLCFTNAQKYKRETVTCWMLFVAGSINAFSVCSTWLSIRCASCLVHLYSDASACFIMLLRFLISSCYMMLMLTRRSFHVLFCSGCVLAFGRIPCRDREPFGIGFC